ncbi:MAG: hypothetical protein ACU0A8_05665 [Limimaricola soesokkakensis]|uniref:hypothetical protein n=1 Tax=Limimaricola soesokkakensis TaxID=1343159 RepID=UPI004059B697
MGKTLSSTLRSADVTDGQRQAIAGHKHGTVLNIHNTAHNTKDLKAAVDKADFRSRSAASVITGSRSFSVPIWPERTTSKSR